MISFALSLYGLDPNEQLLSAIETDNVELAKEAIAQGADVNATDQEGKTPLYLAISWSKAALVNLLLESGADINSKNGISGSTPLYISGLRPDRAILLLSKGADPNIRNKNGSTPLHFAARCGNLVMVKLLLDWGADKNSLDKSGKTAYDLAYDFVRPNKVKDTMLLLLLLPSLRALSISYLKKNENLFKDKITKLPLDLQRELDYSS